ncbi:MAG TPA: hypothetical protein VEK10_08670 [Steroidobacteraceae bacterium]|nr:hypothetical protein [Steroidobacteraceae bacterium]
MPSRRELICGSGALAATAFLGGCAAGGAGAGGVVRPLTGETPAPPSAPPQPLPHGAISAATLSVASRSACRIGPGFAGLSYEKSALALPCFTADNADLAGLFRELGPSLLRIGGNTVDRTQWLDSGAGRVRGQVAPSDVDSLGAFLRACGWRVLYGVNLVSSTPAAAAAEVAYAAQSLGDSLFGIEIGNEPDLYGGGYFPGWTLSAFEQRWQEFRRAILARTPNVVLTGADCADHIGDWTVPFAADTAGQIALLTQHYYRGPGKSPSATIARLLSPDTDLAADLDTLRAGALAAGVPFRLTETNSFWSGGAPGVSDRYAAALWVIDHLFRIAQGGGSGANLHGGGGGYTPIADSNGTVVEARPAYYGMRLFTLAGEGTLRNCALSAGELNLSAYALERADESLSLVVVNKEAAQNLSLSIDCGSAVDAATLIALTGPAADAASDVAIQGTAIGNDGRLPPADPYALPHAGSLVHCYVGALSAALIRIT